MPENPIKPEDLQIEEVSLKESALHPLEPIETEVLSDALMTDDELDNSGQVNQSESLDKTSNSSKYIILSIICILILLAVVFNLNSFIDLPNSVTTGSFVKNNETHPTEETLTEYTYNGQQFKKIDNFWKTDLRTGNTIYTTQFYYGPKELENIPIEGITFHPLFQEETMYITFNPTEENHKFIALSVAQLNTHLIRTFKKKLIAACDRDETTACEGRPIINCDNTNHTAIFYMKRSNYTKVTLKDNCVIIEGQGYDLIKATENVLMRAYKIIN